MDVRLGDLDDPRVADLLREHLAGVHASSPPGAVYALDVSGLRHPFAAFYTGWDGDDLVRPRARAVSQARLHGVRRVR